MDPPKCRTCGERHWGRVCEVGGVMRADPVTKPVTPVTKAVTCAQCERYKLEIAALKAQLRPAVPAKERMRQMRERKKCKSPSTTSGRAGST
jgi:hypothetical protein